MFGRRRQILTKEAQQGLPPFGARAGVVGRNADLIQ
jgi:hypothetical protein